MTVDKVNALGTAISKARIDLDAGVEGAGDTLANLYSQRLGALKDAYGTTSSYANERASTLSDAQAAVARANAQIVSAQAGTAQTKSDPALTTTNATLEEIADQNSRIAAGIEQTNMLLAKGTGLKDAGFDLSAMSGY